MDENIVGEPIIITSHNSKASVIKNSDSCASTGRDNMETKGINIPTDAQHAGSNISITSRSKDGAATAEEKANSDHSYATPSTTQSLKDTNSVSGTEGSKSFSGGSVTPSEIGVREEGSAECKSDIGVVDSCSNKKINECNRTIIPVPGSSSDIDPVQKGDSTLDGELTEQLGRSSDQGGVRKEGSSDLCKAQCTVAPSDSSTFEGTDNKSATLGSSSSNGNCSKPPVPNFRLEGSSAGDTSVTVGVASLSTVSACISLHSSAGHCGSTGGSNSLDNGEQPGSSSGHVSIQSSEEMRLSLVSWYSEPDDPSRLIEGCCSALNTYRKDDNGVTEDTANRKEICDSAGSMGQKEISLLANGSPPCKSESEEVEKENKTPEPNKINNVGSGTDGSANGGTFTKSELINCNRVTSKAATDTPNDVTKSNQEELINSQSSQAKNEESGSGSSSKANGVDSKVEKCKHTASSSQRKVKVPDHKHQSCSSTSSSAGSHRPKCHQDGTRHMNTECPRCSRRSKSGTTTPATGTQMTRTRTPANRRVVQSCKSSTEIKKPIKSILKHDSRGSGSGSDKQSSMDSLGSSGDMGITPTHPLRGRIPSTLMTRSDSGARARFNFNSALPSETLSGPPEDKVVSKLKRIEKYATLRVRKTVKPRPLDFGDEETPASSSTTNSSGNNSGGKVGVPGVPGELMSKSMSYLEKSSNRVHISSAQGHAYGESTSASSTLKRHGSLRAKKQTTPQWEISGNRTSALRLQKMQATKAKNCSGTSSGSANSGSGDSLHFLPHSANVASSSAGSSGMSGVHLSGALSAGQSRMCASAAAKEKHMGAKVFSKLSSALGQTASSNQKRVKQERGVQTDTSLVNIDLGRVSLSPIPVPDSGQESTEQIKNLEKLCNRYRNQYMKVQCEYEKSESNKIELQKQLEETQHESTEMIEFLQAEKSTLAESLTEVEVEAKKWKDEMEALKTDYQSRCSSLVRLSEQHKQEALKSQALLHRMENQSASVISQLSHQIFNGAQSVQQTKLRVTTLTESLLKTYKVPPELLNASEANQTIKETDLSCSLLLPLITSLSAAFPTVPLEALAASTTKANSTMNTTDTTGVQLVSGSAGTSSMYLDAGVQVSTVKGTAISHTLAADKTCNPAIAESSSFQSLNQAILEREAAEMTGLDAIMKPFGLVEGLSPETDQLSLKKEIAELNVAIAKLLKVVRVIVIHCDRKVSSVASSILQCLKSIEDDKGGNMAEIAQVQKSLEAWSEKGIATGSSSTTHGASPPCKSTVTSTAAEEGPPAYLVGNGHAHV